MTHEPLINEIRFELSKRFPIAQGRIDLFRYQLMPLPSRYEGHQEAILAFQDGMEKGHSNAEHEGEIILSVLAMLFDCKIKKTGYRLNGLDISGHSPVKAPLDNFFGGEIGADEYATLVHQIFTLGDQLTKQFIRACNSYSLAISSIELDRALSFLLLVTALECISTQEELYPNTELDKSKKSVERYCRLVKEYCTNPQELYPSDGEDGFFRDLKTVYYSHRSAFVHGGKEISIASKVADQTDCNSIGHFVEGKEIFTPGLKWFFQVTRRTLVGFVSSFPRTLVTPNLEVLADIARSRSVLTMRVGGSDV
jgi:hypothetical protein